MRPIRLTDDVLIWLIFTHDVFGNSDGYDRAGPFVENIVAQHHDRSLASLFTTNAGIQLRPHNVAHQYSVHCVSCA